jgi:arylsulfatase A-like enzyme
MDMNIGRLLKEVKALDLDKRTLIFFTSDNGPENEAGSAGRHVSSLFFRAGLISRQIQRAQEVVNGRRNPCTCDLSVDRSD